MVKVERVWVRSRDNREHNHVAYIVCFENTLYTRWLELVITTRRLHSCPHQGLSTIKYKNRLRLKLMTPSGSGLVPLKPNSAQQLQKLLLFQTSKSVSLTLTCPSFKCKLISMQIARQLLRCCFQTVVAPGRTRSSKTESTGLSPSKPLWGRNKTGASPPSYRHQHNLSHRYQSRRSPSLQPQAPASLIPLTRR